MSKIDGIELRDRYRKKFVISSNGEETTEKDLEEQKQKYINAYNQHKALKQQQYEAKNKGNEERNQPAPSTPSVPELSGKPNIGREQPFTGSVQTLLGNAIEAFMKEAELNLIVPQKPNYLSKAEDKSLLYSRYTFFQFQISPQIMFAEMNILFGAVAIVGAFFTGGSSLLMLSLAAGGAVLGAADIGINVQKINDLNEGKDYTDPTFMGMNQDFVNIAGLVVGAGELGLGLKALLKSGDLAAYARNIDELDEVLDGGLKRVQKSGKGGSWEAQNPMFGKDWEAYFQAKYGAGNVTWETKWKGKFNELLRTKTNKGMEVEFINPAGKTIKWVEQNPKNIPGAIDIAKKSSNDGKAIEGIVGEYVQEKTDVIGFGLKMNNISTRKPAGDIDILTNNQIIEVKKSMSAFKMDQIDKYINPNHPNFFNYEQREIVVYVNEIIDTSDPHITKIIQELNSKGVKIVNSKEDLWRVLK
ncbi:hypothetical protein ACLD72_005335 [Paenibacillus sp. TH7-28]